MDTLCVQIRPLTAFGGVIKGDTLFGQICWAIVHRCGTDRLQELLQGYTDDNPFLVCSDAFPQGYLPRPALPLHCYTKLQEEDRKQVKKRQWLPLEKVAEPLAEWLGHALSDQEVVEKLAGRKQTLTTLHPQPHNMIHRGLNTTQGSEFAPYAMPQYWFAEGLELDLWLLFEPERIGLAEVKELLADIGNTGFGRDAGIGLGKFSLESSELTDLPRQDPANACVTLAPCAPQGLSLNREHCYYDLFTRFGRHGDRAVHSGKPFKSPVLLANSGAILSGVQQPLKGFIGQGLGGGGRLSNAVQETVHQGYAPCIAVHQQGADQ